MDRLRNGWTNVREGGREGGVGEGGFKEERRSRRSGYHNYSKHTGTSVYRAACEKLSLILIKSNYFNECVHAQ